MAGDNLNVWYDPEGDHLEIVFDQKTGYFEDTSLENVMRKRDADGNLLAMSIFNLSSFAGTRPHPESTSGHGLWAVFNLDIDDGAGFQFDVALGHERFEDIEPESTSVVVASADLRAPCSVFFHADRSSLRRGATVVVECTLEIIHKPLLSPVISIGQDLLSPGLLALSRSVGACAEALPAPKVLDVPSGTAPRGARPRLPRARCAPGGGAQALRAPRPSHEVPAVRWEAP